MISEFRQDIVSGDWIIVAPQRGKRPQQFKKQEKEPAPLKSECPFEEPQKSGNPEPILVYNLKNQKDWFLQIFPNKFPVFEKIGECLKEKKIGPYKLLDGIGAHEVLITRNHDKHFGLLNQNEWELIVKAYKERYILLSKEYCINYILIMHNYGKEAGASIYHPHSQIFGVSVVPPDVNSSLEGSRRYYHKQGKCVHCVMIEYELKDKSRIIFENENFVAFCPFASRVNYEIRIFPKFHSPNFEKINANQEKQLAEIFRECLHKIYKKLNDRDYNFFIHTAPTTAEHNEHYHWHIEILPRIATLAGFEIGTGIEIITVLPEEAAKQLH